MPVVGRYLPRTCGKRREQSLWLCLWLPLSSWERGLGGEVAGSRLTALLAIRYCKISTYPSVPWTRIR